jgi:cytosine/adenosine deaminase-related metal-dependent hydrolase
VQGGGKPDARWRRAEAGRQRAAGGGQIVTDAEIAVEGARTLLQEAEGILVRAQGFKRMQAVALKRNALDSLAHARRDIERAEKALEREFTRQM